MGLLLSPTQRAHLEKGKQLFFSPEAIALRDDPILGGTAQKLAALDHFMGGWKNLEPRYGVKGELPGMNLGVDDEVVMDALEAKRQEIAETKRYMEDGEIADMFSALTEEELAYLSQAAEELIAPGAIDKIGELGTKDRLYPKNYADPALAGKKIPANFAPGEKRERGLSLLLQKMQNIDVDTGVGTYGNAVDALHREAAANNPALLTDIGNIRMGNRSLNQSVQDFEGEQLDSSLLTRLLRLNDEEFFLENNVQPAPPDVGSLTKSENRLFSGNSLQKLIDKEVGTIRQEDGVDFMGGSRMAGEKLMHTVSDTDRNRGKVNKFIVNTEGGDFHLDTKMDKRDSSGPN